MATSSEGAQSGNLADDEPSILLLEDDPADAEIIMEVLRAAPVPHRLQWVPSLPAARRALQAGRFDLLLTDLQLPGVEKLGALETIHGLLSELAVIVITGQSDWNEGLRFVRAGAQDFFLKDQLDGERLARAIQTAIIRKRREFALERIAAVDELTGLPSRSFFYERVDRSVAQSGGPAGVSFPPVLMSLDMLRWGWIPDDASRDLEDHLMTDTGARIKRAVWGFSPSSGRPSWATAARVGLHEFVVLLQGCSNVTEILEFVRNLYGELTRPMIGAEPGQRTVRADTNIGIARGLGPDLTRKMLLERSRAALRRARAQPQVSACFATHAALGHHPQIFALEREPIRARKSRPAR